MPPPASEFGMCPCSGRYEQRSVEVRMTVGGNVVVLKDVPQGVCPLCDSRVYKVGDLAAIEAVLSGRPAPLLHAVS